MELAKQEVIKKNLKDKHLKCLKYAEDKKGINIVLLDMRNLSSFSDYFLICSGTSSRHVQAIAQHIDESFSKEGIYPLGIEGFSNGLWILMDYDDLIVHIFYDPIRSLYDLENLWGDAPKITPDMA